MEAAVDARCLFLTLHNGSKIVRKLPVQGPTRVCNFVAPMQPLDGLLRAERDKYTEHNNSDFAGKLAPAVQRFWKMEVHAAGPQQITS